MSSFQEGDHVRALILSIDAEKKRISFGLKPSYFADDVEDEGDGAAEGMEEEFTGISLGAVDVSDPEDDNDSDSEAQEESEGDEEASEDEDEESEDEDEEPAEMVS